jgi:hypothetical protein
MGETVDLVIGECNSLLNAMAKVIELACGSGSVDHLRA